MSNSRSAVHATTAAAWKPMDFLSLPREAGGFSGAEFRSQVEPGFHGARIEAMPDNSLRAPALWRPAAAPATAQSGAATALALGTPQTPSPDTVPGDAQLQHIRTQAFEEGLVQGRGEGEAAAQQRLLPQVEAARQQGVQDIRDLLIQLGEAVADLQQQADTLHEPLKRLALHLAEELVLGELSLSASAIDRLVQRCIDTVDGQGAQQLVVELHPQDLAMLQQHPDAEADRPGGWTWQASQDLLPGSVRVRMNEAVVSDFIEHRLQSLAKQLLGQPATWSAHSAFEPGRLAERRRQEHPIEDALPRMGATPEPVLGEAPPAWANHPAADAFTAQTPPKEAAQPEQPSEDGGHA